MADESMEGLARNEPRCAECIARPFDAKNPHAWKDYPSTEYDDYANAKHEAWDDGARVGFAAGRAALPDPPTDEADLRDIIERLRANLAAIETLGGDNAVSDGEVLAAAWATSATIHLNELCAALPAASPDERLREALTRANDDLIQIADYSPSEVADAIDSVRAAIKDALAADREENTDA